MDASAFKKFVLPLVVKGLEVLGKYIVPPICAWAGIEAAEGNSWWTATAAVLAGLIVGGVTSWLTKKKALTVTDAKIDAKIAEYDATPDGPAKP